MERECGEFEDRVRRQGFRKGYVQGFPEGYSKTASKVFCKLSEEKIQVLLQDAVAKGMFEGSLVVLVGLVRDGVLSESEAAKRLDIAPDEFSRLAASEHLRGA